MATSKTPSSNRPNWYQARGLGLPLGLLFAAALATGACLRSASPADSAAAGKATGAGTTSGDSALIADGKRIFRFDTFGDEQFWTDTLRLHEVVEKAVDPTTALKVGLKVDADVLPPGLLQKVDLKSPATTVALLKLNAILGLQAEVDSNNRITRLGITCALCHSSVDNSVMPGIGHRRDGWANRDLNVGAIIALSPSVQPFVDLLRLAQPGIDAATVRTVLRSWGPGKFDAELLLDGKAFRPDGKSAATLIPPAFGLAGVNLHTWTGWGSVTHWNGFVANLEMQGSGTFYDPRLNDASKFPIAAAAGFGDVRNDPDLVTSKLAALHVYQLSLPAPRAPHGSYSSSAARRGKALFAGKADCARCHVPPLYTEPGWNMHTPDEIGIDAFQAERSPDERYRTAPLKGLWTHTKGGFYHDGRFGSLRQVIDHYNRHFSLGLTSAEKTDLVEYLKSL